MWYGNTTYELLEQFKLVRLCPYTIPLGGFLRLAVAGAIWRLASTPASGSNASSLSDPSPGDSSQVRSPVLQRPY